MRVYLLFVEKQGCRSQMETRETVIWDVGHWMMFSFKKIIIIPVKYSNKSQND